MKIRPTQGVSYPRSGHAAVFHIAKDYFGDAFIYCDTSMDVGQAYRLIDEYKLKAILVVGRDCYKAVELLSKRKLPIILDPTLVYWRTDPNVSLPEQPLCHP